jgi:RHS repeat-associated protein
VAALAHLKPTPSSGPTSWTAGEYHYDGSGNVIAIGSESFVYDKIGRLKTATVRGPDPGTLQTQAFTHDAYGNLIATEKLGQTIALPVSSATNRLDGVGYDASGNVISDSDLHYDYDAVGMMNTIRVGTSLKPRVVYAYTADDERLFSFDVDAGTTHWTVRGFDNKVLRDFKQVGAVWSVERDYVYRDGLLLAALKPGGAVEHYTLDHLGTPRLITDASGHKIGYHAYWPFGEEWTSGTAQEGLPLKFTGHERDGDLDYMHARHYRAGWGRFLSADRGKDWDPKRPQSWNMYAYVRGNPLGMTDPTGRNAEITCNQKNNCTVRAEIQIVRAANDPLARATARAFKQNAEKYWNRQHLTGPNGESVRFRVKVREVNAGQAAANKDKMIVVNGTGVAKVNMNMALVPGAANPPDAGLLFTTDATGNPSGHAGVDPHETGHFFGLRDHGPRPLPNWGAGTAAENIMEYAQPANSPLTAVQELFSPANTNVSIVHIP